MGSIRVVHCIIDPHSAKRLKTKKQEHYGYISYSSRVPGSRRLLLLGLRLGGFLRRDRLLRLLLHLIVQNIQKYNHYNTLHTKAATKKQQKQKSSNQMLLRLFVQTNHTSQTPAKSNNKKIENTNKNTTAAIATAKNVNHNTSLKKKQR